MSGYRSWARRDLDPATEDERLIIALFKRGGQKLGHRQLKMRFERACGRRINHKKVRRIMRDHGLKTKIRRANKFRAIHRLGEENKVAPNHVRRKFTPTGRDQVWSTDITELRFSFGQKAYLSAVKDLRSRQIVSWSVGSGPTIGLAIGELPNRIQKLPARIKNSLTIHSDQGFQYTSEAFRTMLVRMNVRQSMSRKGNCLDNAPIESFFGHFKDEAELKDCRSLQEVRMCVQRYMKFYNEERPQWSLKQKTPAEAGVLSGLVL